MLATVKLETGIIKLLSVDTESGKVRVQFNDEKAVKRVLKLVNTMTITDATFRFKDRTWFLGYDFNLVIDANGKLMPPTPVEDMLPCFVYGTLRTGMGNHGYLKGRLERAVPAKVEGEMYHNGSFPYMFESNNTVRGELMYINPEKYDVTMRDLDRLEGFYGEGERWNHYNRKTVTAVANDGSEVKAWAYYANESSGYPDKNRLVRIKDGDFVRWYNEYNEDWNYVPARKRRRI